MPNNFTNQVGGININFDTIPDLQPKTIRGIIKVQTLPEENILRDVIPTVPVDNMLFKAMQDDGIDMGMTPEVSQNSDDPMVDTNWRWKTDQIHEYRQAAKINREVGQKLLAPDGSPTKYAGQAELNRLIGRITTAIDNRREHNRAMAMVNAHRFDPSRMADLSVTNSVTVVDAKDKWDYSEKDVQGNYICNPFNQIASASNRLAFVSGKNPNAMMITPDILTAIQNHPKFAVERQPAKKKGARFAIRDLDVFVSQGRKNVGTIDSPRIVPLFANQAIICTLGDQDTIAENQYDINRVEQFTTADRLFYYVRYWHKSKVHVARPINFMYFNNVLANPYKFDDMSSLLKY